MEEKVFAILLTWFLNSQKCIKHVEGLAYLFVICKFALQSVVLTDCLCKKEDKKNIN